MYPLRLKLSMKIMDEVYLMIQIYNMEQSSKNGARPIRTLHDGSDPMSLRSLQILKQTFEWKFHSKVVENLQNLYSLDEQELTLMLYVPYFNVSADPAKRSFSYCYSNDLSHISLFPLKGTFTRWDSLRYLLLYSFLLNVHSLTKIYIRYLSFCSH